MAGIDRGDIKNSLKAASDLRAQAYADDVQVINGVWRALNVTLEVVVEAHEQGGSMSGGSAAMFVAKKGLAVAGVAGDKNTSESVKAATFVAGQVVGTAELGTALSYAASPGRASAFITLKIAEKVVSAAGFGQVDKCKHALMVLTVNAGSTVFACVATGPALCILGTASLALEAMSTYAQCQLPPASAAPQRTEAVSLRLR